jgi:hypothetical protein
MPHLYRYLYNQQLQMIGTIFANIEKAYDSASNKKEAQYEKKLQKY